MKHAILFLFVASVIAAIAGCHRGEAYDPPPPSPGNSTYDDHSAAGAMGPEKILGDEITK